LGEDGIFPYYGFEICSNYLFYLPHRNFYEKAKMSFWCLLNRNVTFDHRKIDRIVVLKKKLVSYDLLNQYEVDEVKLEQENCFAAFEILNRYYCYKEFCDFQNIDIVFFDNDLSYIGAMTEEQEYKVLSKIFAELRKLRVYVKLKPAREEIMNRRMRLFNRLEREIGLSFFIRPEDANVPWEIIYYTNRDNLRKVKYMGFAFSSAFLSPAKFFGDSVSIICLRKLSGSELPLSKDLIEWTKQLNMAGVFEELIFPSSLEELRSSI